jgi:hypothetical protein
MPVCGGVFRLGVLSLLSAKIVVESGPMSGSKLSLAGCGGRDQIITYVHPYVRYF